MKSVLLIVPYDNIYPPMNGGMKRCFHIIHQLSKYFALTVIMHQDKDSFSEAAKEYPAISSIIIYSTKDEKGSKDILNLLPGNLTNAIRYRWIKKDVTKPADASFLLYYPVLKKLVKNNRYDIVILENLFTTNAVKTIRKYAKTATIIYDAHNVDSNLVQAPFIASGIGSKNINGIRKAESTLYKNVDAIFTCSETDKRDLLKMNRYKLTQAAVIPNGVNACELSDHGVQSYFPEYILFCGVLWSAPNIEGLLWFYNNIWPQVQKALPSLQFLVVGSGEPPESCKPLFTDPSIAFSGEVDDVKPWYNKASVAIVPLLTGSGTRLKILEAMSLGVPVLSTTKGAEGIDYTDDTDIVIADKEDEFAKKLIDLLVSRNKRVLISRKAKILVNEKYDWNIIGQKMAIFTNSIE